MAAINLFLLKGLAFQSQPYLSMSQVESSVLYVTYGLVGVCCCQLTMFGLQWAPMATGESVAFDWAPY